MNTRRTRLLKKGEHQKINHGPVLYWMSRDQRVADNWALLFAQDIAINKGLQLIILFCAVPSYKNAPLRHYHFMIEGLLETSRDAQKLNIPMHLIFGDPEKEIPEYANKIKTSCIITDFDPLKKKRDWKKSVSSKIECDLYEVDAHNIVPCWLASDKQEFAAYTIRPKINKLLVEFLEEFPAVQKMQPGNLNAAKDNNISKFILNRSSIDSLLKKCAPDSSVKPVSWLKSGTSSANNMLGNFLEYRIDKFKLERNDPNSTGAVSNLSPFLHFGQISAQRIALESSKINTDEENRSSFLEELIIRRELSDNFCYYNQSYDSIESYPEWAKASLKKHQEDPRKYLYGIEELQNCLTHDDLWNAAQQEMAITGKMHGYMRMYWAKKILEWSVSPGEAVEKAIYLNDRYELDGRDPNGYTGIAWSMGGLHDRAWGEREIFGKIRYMSYNGCRNKFNIKKYTESINKLAKLQYY